MNITSLSRESTDSTASATSRVRQALRVATLAAVALVGTSQLTACFPVMAGAMAGGVVSATDRRPTPTQTIDRGLQMEAQSTLNSRYDGTARVDVTVFNRKVLLTGEAKNAEIKQQIDQYVRGLQNVREVINELEIVDSPSFMTRSNDTYLTSKVKTMLMTAEGVPSNSIKIVTEKGVVHMMGLVTGPEGDRAVNVARNVAGVTKVVKAFDFVSETERARLDAASSSQNTAPGTTGTDGSPTSSEWGTPAPLSPAGAAPAPVTTPAPVSGPSGAVSEPVTAPVSAPVGTPAGRHLP